MSEFPPLSNWAPTRDTLSFYAKAVGVVPRKLAEPHPKWWHISMKVQDNGIVTNPIPNPRSDGETFQLLMNLENHSVDVLSGSRQIHSIGMMEGLSSTDFGDRLLLKLHELGIDEEFEREKYTNDEPRAYDPLAASTYREILVNVNHVLEHLRSTISGDVGPIQIWPHNFDLAFEWFGKMGVTAGEGTEAPAQISFGLAPGDSSHEEAYFYSNPWPFQDSLLDHELPGSARWFTESWKGSLFPYAEIAESSAGSAAVTTYFRAVYDIASRLLAA